MGADEVKRGSWRQAGPGTAHKAPGNGHQLCGGAGPVLRLRVVKKVVV